MTCKQQPALRPPHLGSRMLASCIATAPPASRPARRLRFATLHMASFSQPAAAAALMTCTARLYPDIPPMIMWWPLSPALVMTVAATPPTRLSDMCARTLKVCRVHRRRDWRWTECRGLTDMDRLCSHRGTPAPRLRQPRLALHTNATQVHNGLVHRGEGFT